MNFNTSYQYFLPPFKDDEDHSVTILVESVPPGLVTFAQIPAFNDYIEFYPKDWSQLMDYDLMIKLTDGILETIEYPIKLTIKNTPPVFKSKIPSKYSVQFNQMVKMNLPNIIDMENNPIFFINMKIPKFITFDSESGTFYFNPKNPETDIGIFQVKG